MVAIPAQSEMAEVVKEVDGEFSNIQLVERIKGFEQDLKRVRGALKRSKTTLVQRVLATGETEMLVGEDRVVVKDKTKVRYDTKALKSLGNVTTEEQIRKVLTEVPASKQLNALSELGGAPAKSVILSAKHRDDTGEKLVRITHPKKPGGRRGGRYGRR